MGGICSDLGLDTMSTGSVIAFGMECFERGLLSKADTDGLDFTFGNNKTMGVCIETFAKIIASVTGFHADPDSLIESAERINCIERAFNVREGISRKDDVLPNRILEESTSELPPFERASMDQLLDEYYKISGWDDNGIPKNEYVRFLGMSDSQTGR